MGDSVTLSTNRTHERITIPGPLHVPAWLRESQSFKRWQVQHDAKTFSTRDDVGNIYEVACQGYYKDADGKEHEMIPCMTMYRADKKLAMTTTFDDSGNAVAWDVMAPSSDLLQWHITRRRNDNGTLKWDRITFFDDQGNERILEDVRGTVIHIDHWCDPVGEPLPDGAAKPRGKL